MRLAIVLLTSTLFAAAVHGQAPTIHQPDNLKWVPAPPSLPKGATIALLEGDPSKEGPFVFRAKMPDGYRVAPHTHSKTERITVLSGTLFLGEGEKFDAKKGHALPAGSYGYWPAGMKHFAWTEGETVIQVHGVGPWGIDYLNPADDPRNEKK
jgi:hypothetical protein